MPLNKKTKQMEIREEQLMPSAVLNVKLESNYFAVFVQSSLPRDDNQKI